MYARMLMVKQLTSESKKALEDIANRWLAAVSTLPGFIDVKFLAEHSTNEIGYISYWESMEQALNVEDKIGDQLPKALSKIIAGAPTIRYFEIYEYQGRN